MAFHLRSYLVVILALVCFASPSYGALKTRKTRPPSVYLGSSNRINSQKNLKVVRRSLLQEEWKSEEKTQEWKPEEKKEEWKPEEKKKEWKPQEKIEEKKEEWKPEESKEEWKPEERKEEWKPVEKIVEKKEEWMPVEKIEVKKEEWKPVEKIEVKKEDWKPEDRNEEVKMEVKKEEWKPVEKVEEKVEWNPEERKEEWKSEERKDGWKPVEKIEEKKEEWKAKDKKEEVKMEEKREDSQSHENEEWKLHEGTTQKNWEEKSEELKVEERLEYKPDNSKAEHKLQETRPEIKQVQKSYPREHLQATPLENTAEAKQQVVKNEERPTVVTQEKQEIMHIPLETNGEMPIEQHTTITGAEKHLRGPHNQVLERLSEHQEQLQQHDRKLRRDRQYHRDHLERRHEHALTSMDHHQEHNPIRFNPHHQEPMGARVNHHQQVQHTPFHHHQEEHGVQDDWTAWEKNEVLKPEDKRMEWSHTEQRFVETREDHESDVEDAEDTHLVEPDVEHFNTEHDIEDAGEMGRFATSEDNQDQAEIEDGGAAKGKPTSMIPSSVTSGSAAFKLQSSKGNVAEHLANNINVFSDQSKSSFVKVNQDLTNSIMPFLGAQYAPVVASVISYCLLLLPLAVVIFVCEQVREFLTLQKAILFLNIYLAVYFELLLVTALGLGSEPMEIFHRYSPSSYLVLQLLQAFSYVLYLALQTVDVVLAYSHGTAVVKSSATVQMVVGSLIGIHYYLTVFREATLGVPPKTSWKAYAFYSIAFMMLCLFARIKRGKKQYLPVGNETTDKKN